MNTVKIVCVGIGGYANIYLESLVHNKSEDFEIVGLVDVCPQNCKYLDELSGVPIYRTMEEFYSASAADLCIITTPIHFHTKQIVTALSHGSNVMCEKPLSGCSEDEKILNEAAEKYGKFVIIGYQWSYSRPVNQLKKDIADGIYGRPVMLKTLVLWPRDVNYFTRSSRWAGRITIDGMPVNDSVAANAAAHYLHNILYVTGKDVGVSSEVTELKADLLRLNAIENFDTAVVRFTMDNGGRGLFVASHDTDTVCDPCFTYTFEKGMVKYDSDSRVIAGRLESGEEIVYGNPFENVNEKIYEAIRACRVKGYKPVCGISAAAPHVRCIEKIQSCPICDIPEELVHKRGSYLYAEGLSDALRRCYDEEKLLSELPDGDRWVRRS